MGMSLMEVLIPLCGYCTTTLCVEIDLFRSVRFFIFFSVKIYITKSKLVMKKYYEID